jgi:ligand-binding sensor domain-containing protein
MAIHLKTKLLTLLAVLALSGGTPLRAQYLQASLAHYSTDDGLTSNAIANLRHDDYGYVWIATWNGISRFDGYNFYNYKTGIASGIRGLHNRIDAITIDQAQNVWLKMYNGRIFVLNRWTDCIEDPLEGVGGHDEFRTDYFFNPYVTSSGDVLISFDGVGLYKLRLNRDGEHQQQLIMTGSLTATCIVEGYRNDIWVGTNQGVHRIDMPNLALERKGYFLDEHITQLATNGYNIFVGTKSGKIMQFSYGQEPTLVKDLGREITSLFIDSHGVIWFSDMGDGAYRLIPETSDVKFFNQRVQIPEYTSRGAEFSEALGVVWIRMNHGGYGYYNRENDEVEYFHNDPSNPWNLSNSVNAHLELNDGVVWESTIRRGLEKLEVQKNTITRTHLKPDAASSLDNEIRAMYYDKKRHLTLLGNKHGVIHIIDSNGNRSTITHDSNGRPFSRAYGLSGDSKGNYWVCDKDNGLYKITPTGNGSYHVINICHNDKDKWSLSHNGAYQAVEDHNGNIWVATYGGGVNVLQKDKNGRYIALHSKNVMKHYPLGSYHKVRTIALAKDGTVWAGTTDGILIMSIQNNRITIKRMEAPEEMEQGLMSNDIVCLACDKNGVMWVGTNSGGLSCATGQDKNGAWLFRNYGIEDGMPSEEVRCITFDEDGNVWFGTDHIICSFNAKKQVFTSFSKLDGVDDTMLSEGAAITGPNGNILFGTMEGYYTVDRRKLTNSTGSLLRLRITDFWLDDVLQTPRLTDTYNYYVPESKSVKLPEHGSEFAFRFAALNYQLQHRLHYQYKLEGYDEDWKNADKTRIARYSGVPTGTYRFQVRTFLLESPDAYDMRTITVTIPPYFFLSAAAVWIYIVLGVMLALVLLWYYQEQLKKSVQGKTTPGSEANADSQETTKEETQVIEEKTDEYEIIEED